MTFIVIGPILIIAGLVFGFMAIMSMDTGPEWKASQCTKAQGK